MAIAKLAEENSHLRHQLSDMALKAEAWACRAQDAEAQLQLINEQQSPVVLQKLIKDKRAVSISSSKAATPKI